MSNVPFAAQMEELAAFFASKISVPTIGIGGGYAPIGTINFFDATTAPQDWLACDGSVHNIADYPQLAEWYATQHGAANFYGGNGTTTFAVPNLQGEFLRGTGTNSHTGQGNGASVGVHQNATQIPLLSAGRGTNTVVSEYVDTTQSTGNFPQNRDAEIKIGTGTIECFNATTTKSSTTSVTYNNYAARPTNTSFLICVKAVVAGEVYSTEEREVGTWINGKKIYQKTYTYSGKVLTKEAWTTFDNISATNIEKIIYCDVISESGSFWACGCACDTYVKVNNKKNADLLVIVLTIRYIKTTD